MNHGTPQPGQSAGPDDLDRLFTAYFRQEMPRHWPAFQPPPAAEPAGLRTTAGAGRSRATLAVSIAALLGFGLYFSSGGRSIPPNPAARPGEPSLLSGATAEQPKWMKDAEKTPEPRKP
jgi:hypothetical protein